MPNRPLIFIKPHSGFKATAYAGPETGVKDKTSYVIRQNKLTFVLTTPLKSGNIIGSYIQTRGWGKVLALRVDDTGDAWEQTTQRGGKSYMGLLL